MSGKRALDLTGAILLILATAPLFAVICLLIACTSRGPVLFRQTRAGRGGTPFTMLKFRTMRSDAEAQRAALAALNDTDGHLFKLRDDPRITPVGRLLRQLSLDELPQLLNVLKGDMSLVGPRPLPLADSHYEGQARGRLEALPGMTGLWQVSGRSKLGWEEMVRLDLQYIRQWSLRLDLLIIARTLPAVLTARGAH